MKSTITLEIVKPRINSRSLLRNDLECKSLLKESIIVPLRQVPSDNNNNLCFFRAQFVGGRLLHDGYCELYDGSLQDSRV